MKATSARSAVRHLRSEQMSHCEQVAGCGGSWSLCRAEGDGTPAHLDRHLSGRPADGPELNGRLHEPAAGDEPLDGLQVSLDTPQPRGETGPVPTAVPAHGTLMASA